MLNVTIGVCINKVEAAEESSSLDGLLTADLIPIKVWQSCLESVAQALDWMEKGKQQSWRTMRGDMESLVILRIHITLHLTLHQTVNSEEQDYRNWKG